MQRIVVDLPDPEGPQITTRSFCAIVMVTSRSTCIVPYHLLTLSSTIAGGAEGSIWWGAPAAASVVALIAIFLSAAACAVQLALETAAVFRHGKAKYEVDDRQRDVDLVTEALPGRVGDRRGARLQQIENADDQHQAGVLEEADEGVNQGWDHHAQRLRQDDQEGLLPVAQPEC